MTWILNTITIHCKNKMLKTTQTRQIKSHDIILNTILYKNESK